MLRLHVLQSVLTLILALIWLGFGASDFLVLPEAVRAKPAATTRAPTPASSPVDPLPPFWAETPGLVSLVAHKGCALGFDTYSLWRLAALGSCSLWCKAMQQGG